MKTLQEIKDELAKECGKETFKDLLWSLADSEDAVRSIDEVTNEVAKRYTDQAIDKCSHIPFIRFRNAILNVKSTLK